MEVAPRLVANPVAERLQFTDQFVVIDVPRELPGAQQLVILERLPAVLDRVIRRVEDDAMRVQMRVERAGGLMGKQGGNEIACQPVALLATHADASGGKRLEFPER